MRLRHKPKEIEAHRPPVADLLTLAGVLRPVDAQEAQVHALTTQLNNPSLTDSQQERVVALRQVPESVHYKQ